jgi:hypothetical protein
MDAYRGTVYSDFVLFADAGAGKVNLELEWSLENT